jgi:prepilin-type processing-associated H-X9-DG protein
VVLAWSLYGSEHEDRLVPNPDSDRLQGAGWVVGNLRLPAVATNLELMANPAVSLLAPYVKDARIYKCPSDESEFIRSIAMNCRLNPTRFDGEPAWLGGAGTNYVVFRRLGDIRNPSGIFVTLAERSDSINDAYFAVDLSNTGTPEGAGPNRPFYIIDYPADYHDGAATLSFGDGHVAGHEWVEKTTKPPLGEARPRSYTSPADRDVQWLQEHCARRK